MTRRDQEVCLHTIEECMKIITTHDEHEGGYCDTGADMEWACRSECTNLALKRLENFRKMIEQYPVVG